MGPDGSRSATATRLAFLVAGFGYACWAPLVPFAKQRLAVDDAALGLLLLCIGVGSILAMPITGILASRHGARPVILAGAAGVILSLPLLAAAGSAWSLGAALFAFGASLGSLDVAMNVHAVDVEKAAGRPMMSGFHAMFSVGGFAGAAAMLALLSFRLEALVAVLICSGAMTLAMLAARPGFLPTASGAQGPLLVRPRGIVLLLAGLASATFLVEGAMLDWGALFLTDGKLMSADRAGAGYMVFSVGMTLGRLFGDRVVARTGDRAALSWGGLLAVGGLGILIAAPSAAIAIAGFALIGLGASNIVPVLFRKAGSQTSMPAGMAIAAISTTGYAGILLGPACLGFIAKAAGLKASFGLLAVLMLLVPLAAGRVVSDATRGR